jgi:hypothetical protein
MIDTSLNATTVGIETALEMAAEIVIVIESDETVAGTSLARKQMGTRMEHLQAIMAVQMAAPSVEAEVEMTTADAATETVLMRLPAEMGISTEAVAACAHDLGVQTETSIAHETAVPAMMATLLQEKIVETEMIAARVEVPRERAHLH